MTNTFDLAAAFDKLQSRLAAALEPLPDEHPVAQGDNTEANWIKMLDQFLPNRYHIDRAFVVDIDGNRSDFLDVVIYDRQYSPLLFEHDGARYIPAESVYATFEVKQDLTKAHIEYAGAKVASVRDLRRTSADIAHAGGTFVAKEPNPIIGGILATTSGWKPPLGEAFTNAVKGLDETSRLDIGCALDAGTFLTRTDPETTVEVFTGGRVLLSFALELFAVLQPLGTVTALNMSEWIDRARSTT